MKLIQKYPGLVERHYTMNPKTEVLLPNSVGLENGMVILIAGVVYRFEIQGKTDLDYGEMSTPLVLERNRWCTVKNVASYDNTVTFIGVYEDGSEVRRIVRKDTAWLVKIGPVVDTTVEDKREKIFDLVREAMFQAESAGYMRDTRDLPSFAEETTDKIMKLI